MTKSSSKSKRSSTTVRNTSGRPMPMTPKAGYTQTRRRYEAGGRKTCK